jgi:hypothetical protein
MKYILLLMALIIGFAPPARAEVDYRCLNMCIGNGKSSPACMDQCTYNKPLARLRPHIDAVGTPPPDPHKVFKAPIPLSGMVVAHKDKNTGTQKPDKDYACYMQCLQNGMQPRMCNEQCTGVKKTGTNDLQRTTNMAPANTTPSSTQPRY